MMTREADRQSAEDQRRAFIIGGALFAVVLIATLIMVQVRAGAITWYSVGLAVAHGLAYFFAGFAAGHRSVLGVLFFGGFAVVITWALLVTTGRLT